MRLTRHPDRNDWFFLPEGWSKHVGKAPSLAYDGKREAWIGHRSHLPLLSRRLDVSISVEALDEELEASDSVFVDGTRLRPYQEEAVEFLRARHGVLLADGCRVGKTASLVAAHDPDDGPLVVVGPLNVRPVWLDWFRRRWPDCEPAVLRGRSFDPELIDGAALVFVHYDVLPYWVSAGIGRRIGTLVFDEAHALSNKGSKRSQAAHILATAAKKAQCATGTPLWNAPAGVWSVLSACVPGAFGSFREFTARYASGSPGAYGWTTGGPTNVEEFRLRMSEVMLCRRWEDIREDLPPVVRNVETAALTTAEGLQLDKMAMDIRDRLYEDSVDFGDPTLVGHLARIRRLVAKKKAPVAADRATAIMSEGERVVVWTWHVDVAEVIAKRLKKSGPVWVIIGDTPHKRREPILDEWRVSVAGALVVSMAVAPAGIDLSQAAYCILVENDWTPATMGQAEMRTYSPDRPNFITHIVADHEIDWRLLEVIQKKVAYGDAMGLIAADTVGSSSSIYAPVVGPEENVDLGSLASRIAQSLGDN